MLHYEMPYLQREPLCHHSQARPDAPSLPGASRRIIGRYEWMSREVVAVAVGVSVGVSAPVYHRFLLVM
jgi:hypothetical protein